MVVLQHRVQENYITKDFGEIFDNENWLPKL
jgi:hypothetical protein